MAAWGGGGAGGPAWLTWLRAGPASPHECLWPAPDRKAMGSDHLASPPFQSSDPIMEQRAGEGNVETKDTVVLCSTAESSDFTPDQTSFCFHR